MPSALGRRTQTAPSANFLAAFPALVRLEVLWRDCRPRRRGGFSKNEAPDAARKPAGKLTTRRNCRGTCKVPSATILGTDLISARNSGFLPACGRFAMSAATRPKGFVGGVSDADYVF
jgi:hypothetical protein